MERYENQTLLAIADGCNWGKKPASAAYALPSATIFTFRREAASKGFVEWVKDRIYPLSVTTTDELIHKFVEAFATAHLDVSYCSYSYLPLEIIEGKENLWDCGTTTLLGGIIFEVPKKEERRKRRETRDFTTGHTITSNPDTTGNSSTNTESPSKRMTADNTESREGGPEERVVEDIKEEKEMEKEKETGDWAFCAVSLGDCKAYRIRLVKKRREEKEASDKKENGGEGSEAHLQSTTPTTPTGTPAASRRPKDKKNDALDVIDITNGSRISEGVTNASDCGYLYLSIILLTSSLGVD